jgi:hypothetical protein
MKIEMQIVELYHELQCEIQRVAKNAESPLGIVKEYAKTLPPDKREMLDAIRSFRNMWAHATPVHPAPKLPDNYCQEWIDFLKSEISKLKKSK